MSIVDLGPVTKSIEVRRSAAAAFRIFVDDIARWWPVRDHSRAKDALGERTERVDFEARVGGRIYETLNTGETREWGEVLRIAPGESVAFAFQMGRARDKSGEVEIRFEPLGDDTCRVILVHSHWERFGDEADAMRGAFSRGWEFVFVDGFGTYAGTL